MDWEEFKTKVLEQLRGTDLGDEEDLEAILATFREPVVKGLQFSVSPKGALHLERKGSFFGKSVLKIIHSVHWGAYQTSLLQKLAEYRSLVESNKKNNEVYQSYYHRPRFELEQAKELVWEALSDSFGKVKDLYTKI